MGGEAKKISRRDFIINLSMIGGAVVGAGAFIRSIWQFLYPQTGKGGFTRFLVAKVSEVPVGKTRQIEVGGVPLHVVHLEEGFKVFSGICTHLGCLIKWEGNKQRFYCPCHQGVFAPDGRVMSGPPPRSLDEYRVAVEGNLVFIETKQRKGRWS